VIRVTVASAGGWIAIYGFGAGLSTMFLLVAVSFVLFGTVIAAATWAGKVV
jgi:D-arabinose 1-dehydrogenase-like Zn-dependent alcohol dehydrogenase